MNAAAAERVGNLISGYWQSQAVYVAAKLGLPDQLAHGPRTADDLAALVQVQPGPLFRLLRALASIGVFRETSPQTFENTPESELLRGDVPGTQRPLALMMGEEHYHAWGRLLFSVQTGRGSFQEIYGEPIFQFLATRPEPAATFDAAMTAIHGRETAAMLDAFDFSRFGTLCDVGGGNGSLLIKTLERTPGLKGMLYDLPHVVERARPNFAAAGVSDRVQVSGGDFFAEIPAGADAYLLRHIIHDWDDAKATLILQNIARVLRPEGRVLLVESVVPPGNEPSFTKWLDLTMLVIPEGKERTEPEYRALLAGAGLELVGITPTASEIGVLEARRAT